MAIPRPEHGCNIPGFTHTMLVSSHLSLMMNNYLLILDILHVFLSSVVSIKLKPINNIQLQSQGTTVTWKVWKPDLVQCTLTGTRIAQIRNTNK